MNLLTVPLKDLSKDQRSAAFALYDKKLSDIRTENSKFKSMHVKHLPSVMSDDLGLKGVLNHADGRIYDSKSSFRKATRRAGCYELGNDVTSDNMDRKRETHGDFNVRPELKQALERVFGT